MWPCVVGGGLGLLSSGLGRGMKIVREREREMMDWERKRPKGFYGRSHNNASSFLLNDVHICS